MLPNFTTLPAFMFFLVLDRQVMACLSPFPQFTIPLNRCQLQQTSTKPSSTCSSNRSTEAEQVSVNFSTSPWSAQPISTPSKQWHLPQQTVFCYYFVERWWSRGSYREPLLRVLFLFKFWDFLNLRAEHGDYIPFVKRYMLQVQKVNHKWRLFSFTMLWTLYMING